MLNVKSVTGFVSIVVLTALLMVWGQYAQATLVKTSFNGEVNFDNGGSNPFGLVNGDTISGSATYDDAFVVGATADELFILNDHPGSNFSATLGSFSFTQATVTDPTFTGFIFNFGALDGLSFFINPIDIGGTNDIQIRDFNLEQSIFAEDSTSGNPVYLEATWDFPNATTVPVPVSGTLILLGLGLVGLSIVRRHKSV